MNLVQKYGLRSGRKKMQLPKYTQFSYFEIFQPRWHDKTVLVHANRLKNAKTQWIKIRFTKAPSMEGDWVISKKKALSFPLGTNGTTQMRVIPLSALEPLELINDIRSAI